MKGCGARKRCGGRQVASALEAVSTHARWASRRRQDLLDLLDQLTPKIQELTRALEEEVEKRPVTRRLMTHPAWGPLTALAYELVIGTPERFRNGKQIASYVGLVPSGESQPRSGADWDTSASKATLLLRFLLVEAAQVTVRSSAAVAQQVFPSCHASRTEDRQGSDGPQTGGAPVLHVRLMVGALWNSLKKFGSHAGAPGNRHGVQ